MKLLLAVCMVAMVAAAPPRSTYSSDNVQIVQYKNNNIGVGPYKYGYQLSDGTRAEQSGVLRNEGRENEYVAVTGSFSWIRTDGVVFTVRYTADEEGYKPEIEEGPGSLPPSAVASLLG